MSRFKYIYFPVVLALAIVAGIFIGRYYKSVNSENRFYIYPRVDKLSSILNYIEREYVDPISRLDVEEKTIPKILEELDPHSLYIPASDLERVNESLEGNFSGIGIQFNMLNDTLVVINTVANGPSQHVGVMAGDRIIVVDKDTVAGVKMPSDSIVRKLRGPRGTSVSIEVERENNDGLITFQITRDNIPLYSVDVSYMITDEIGYIKINQFAKTTFEEYQKSFFDLQKKGMTKLILDLRDNGGGYMNTAVNIADQFLPNNELIVYTEGNAKGKDEYNSTPGGFCTDVDIIVLIDEGTASASEILAGALQDNDRGTIIGRRSFGKGLVQEQRQFSDGSAVRLTIARYYTPTGRCIQKPYTNGAEDYYNDLTTRYMHGELTYKDSIHFNDSLKFTTPKGKIVYGGGGIMPDIFVPFDTSGVTEYFFNVRNKGLLYRFCLEYSDKDRKNLQKINNPDDFIDYVNRKNVLAKFISFAEREGIAPDYADIKVSKELLTIQLSAYISRNIMDNYGFYPIVHKIDNTLLKAVEEFSEKTAQR